MARANEYVVGILPENVYGIEPDQWEDELLLPIVSIDRAAAEPAAIKDTTIQVEDAEHREIVGLVAGNAQKLDCKAHSFGTLPSVGSAAAHVAETRLLESVYGAAATSTKRSTVKAGSVPTPTEIVETTDDAHLATKLQIVGVQLPSGIYEAAAATYDAATDKLTLRTALSETPATGAEVCAAHVYNYERDPATPPSIAFRAYGHDSLQSFGCQGFTPGLEIAELGPASVPMFSFKGPIAASTRRPTFGTDPGEWTKPYVAPRPGRCAAGLQLRIGKYGSTAMQTISPLRVAIGVRPGYRVLDDVTAAKGAAAAESIKGVAAYIDATVVHTSTPNAILSSSYDDWVDFWENGADSELFHAMLTISPSPGRAKSLYLCKARIIRPEHGAVNDRSTVKLRFIPAPLETADDAAIKAAGECIGASW